MKKLSSKIYTSLIILIISIIIYNTYEYIIKFYIEQQIKHELYINTDEKFNVDVNKINIDFKLSKINIEYIDIVNKNFKNHKKIKLDNIDIKYNFRSLFEEIIFPEIKLSKLTIENNIIIKNNISYANIIENTTKLLKKVFNKINVKNIKLDNIEYNSIEYPVNISFSFNNENIEYMQFNVFINENLTNNFFKISSIINNNNYTIQGEAHCFSFIKILDSNYLNSLIKNLYSTKNYINNITFDGKFSISIKDNKIKKINTYALQAIIDGMDCNSTIFAISSLINIKYLNNNIIIKSTNKDYSGILRYHFPTSDISLQLQVKKISTDALYNLWPNKIALDAREWYRKNISSGILKNINIIFKNEEDFMISGELYNVNSSYYDKLPPFTHSNGKININPNNLTLYISKSQLAENILKNSSLKYNFKENKIDISAKSIGDITAFINYIKKLPIPKGSIDRLQIFINGTLENNIDLSFSITDDKFKLNKLIIDGKMDDGTVNYDKLSNKIKNIDGEYTLNIDKNYDIAFDGNFLLENNNSIKIKYKNNIYKYNITSNINYLTRLFGYQKPYKQDGDVKIEIIKNSINNFYTINGDFINTKLYIPYFDRTMNIDNQSMSLEASIENNQIIFNKILYNHQDNLISGDIVYDININALKMAILKVKINKNDFTIKYNNDNDYKNINIKGNQLDLSELNSQHHTNKLPTDINKILDSLSQYKIIIDLNEINYNNMSIFDIKANIDIDQLKNISLSGSFDKKEYIHLYSIDDILYLQTNNAGKFLKMLGIINSINEGSLTIRISTENKRNKIGDIQINNFFIKNMPGLTKILSLASFTGIIDILQGDGIYFSNFKAPFTYNNSIFFIKNALAEGVALGVNFDSIYSLYNNDLIMNGSLTPLYILNKLIWKIPVIGKMLTGEQNHSLMTVNYSIHRKNNHNDISIDPLSLLVPQGIRKIYKFFS